MIYFLSKYKAKSMKLCINIRHCSAGWVAFVATKSLNVGVYPGLIELLGVILYLD